MTDPEKKMHLAQKYLQIWYPGIRGQKQLIMYQTAYMNCLPIWLSITLVSCVFREAIKLYSIMVSHKPQILRYHLKSFFSLATYFFVESLKPIKGEPSQLNGITPIFATYCPISKVLQIDSLFWFSSNNVTGGVWRKRGDLTTWVWSTVENHCQRVNWGRFLRHFQHNKEQQRCTKHIATDLLSIKSFVNQYMPPCFFSLSLSVGHSF